MSMENNFLVKSVAFLGSSFFVLHAAAGPLSKHSPDEVCDFLRHHGMEAHEWRYDKSQANAYECNSSYKELDDGYPISNNIAYYVNGTKNSASKVKLVLNVNDKSKSKAVRAALLKEANFLAGQIGDIKLPKNIKDAILKGESSQAEDKDLVIEVSTRDWWPDGNGYEIHVSFYEEKLN